MAAILSSLKDALWFAHNKAPCIDSWTFQIYNRVTTSLLAICSVVVVARQFFGEPIRCDAGEVSKYSIVWPVEDFSSYLPSLSSIL